MFSIFTPKQKLIDTVDSEDEDTSSKVNVLEKQENAKETKNNGKILSRAKKTRLQLKRANMYEHLSGSRSKDIVHDTKMKPRHNNPVHDIPLNKILPNTQSTDIVSDTKGTTLENSHLPEKVSGAFDFGNIAEILVIEKTLDLVSSDEKNLTTVSQVLANLKVLYFFFMVFIIID